MEINENPEIILRLARQFMESRILLSAVEINIFTLLDGKQASVPELASSLDADLRGLTILLDALAAMGLISKKEDLYQCSPNAALFLSEKSNRSLLPMIRHLVNLWESWSNLTNKVKKPALINPPDPDIRNIIELHAFIGAMHVVGEPMAQKIAAVVQPGKAKSLIDIGGASGTYTIAFLRAAPEMKATLFDRSMVIPIARERLIKSGLIDRVNLVAGNFYKDEFPGGHDLVLISAIIHQNSPAENIELFKKASRAMVPGGRIIIRDHVMEPDRTEPREGAIFAVNMLVNTEGGGTYTFNEIKDWLVEAGFVKIRLLQAGKHMNALVEGFKP
ncbi:MAG: methyltransferase [Smithella sp.]